MIIILKEVMIHSEDLFASGYQESLVNILNTCDCIFQPVLKYDKRFVSKL